MATFTQITDTEFKAKVGGNLFHIKKNNGEYSCFGEWLVFVDNASRRAWNGLGVKEFPTLEAVEANYKSLRGICALANLQQEAN